MLYIRAAILRWPMLLGTDHMMYVGQVQILSVIKVLFYGGPPAHLVILEALGGELASTSVVESKVAGPGRSEPG